MLNFSKTIIIKNLILIIVLVIAGSTVAAQNYNNNFNYSESPNPNPVKSGKDTFPRITITDPSKLNIPLFISKSFYWLYGRYQFSATLKIKTSDYDYYRKLSKALPYERYAEDHEGHRYFADLCKQLDEEAKKVGYEGIELVNYLTAFVQQGVPYVSDIGEYKKYPIETIAEYGGDCEDKAALLAALLNTFGFDACMVLLPGHMVVGISCTNCGGYYEHDGKKYSFIETTNGGWRIGQVPPAYLTTNATILEVSHTDYYKREETQFAKKDDRKKNRFGGSVYNDDPPNVIYTQPQVTYVPQPQVIYVPTTQPSNQYGYGYTAPVPVYNNYQQQCRPKTSPIQFVPNGNGGKITIFGQTFIKW